MPRTGRRRSLTTAAALLAMLAAPAAAQAATYTVKAGDGPCGAADLACGSLADAAAAAATGDVFNVAAGTYGSATFAAGGITITGTGPNAAVDGALVFSAASGGVSKLQKMSITLPTGSGPAVSVTGAAGLEVSDAFIFGTAGDGIQFHEGTANKVVRSIILTGGQATAAARVLSADLSTTPKALTLESTLLTGGAAGLSVNTGTGGPATQAGGATVTLRHVTAAGSTNGLVFDSSKAIALLGGPFGNISATIVDSIIQNGTAKTSYPGVVLLAPPNTITDTYATSLTGAFDSAAVFSDPARRRYTLKAGSPAINAGGFTAGESTTDFEGQDRSAAPTDQGFDEYVAPVVAPPPPPAGPGGPGTKGDGVPPKVVITKPKLNEKVRLTTKTTKTTTVTRNGKKVKVKKTTTKKNKISFTGTATDASGISAVALTVQKLAAGTAAPPATVAPTAKCKWLNGIKGIVAKSCTRPILLLAKVATDGSWTYKLRSTIKLGVGTYRIIVLGLDKSGAAGNTATAAEAIHRFTVIK